MKYFKKSFVAVVLNALALYALTLVLTEISHTGGALLFVVGGVVIGLINTFVKPIIKLVSLPLIFITGGIFLIVINAFSLWFLQYFLEVAAFRDLAISFPNLGSYAIGGLVFGIINWLEHRLIKVR